MAPQVGLEPTTLRLTAECSAIELLRSVAALARVVVEYKEIVTSREAERQTSARKSCGILAFDRASCNPGPPMHLRAMHRREKRLPPCRCNRRPVTLDGLCEGSQLSVAEQGESGEWRRRSRESRSESRRRAR